jgi:formate dehydrogenase major subunit
VINHILSNDLYFEEYVKHYTNAPVIIDESFRDTEDLDGFFSGWDSEQGKYDPSTWQYAGMAVHGSASSARSTTRATPPSTDGSRRRARPLAPRCWRRPGSGTGPPRSEAGR